MELVAHRIQLPRTDTKVYGHLLTDVHREAVGCDKKAFKRDIASIKTKNETSDGKELHYWLGGGDWNNGISAKDRRFDATAVSPEFARWIGKNLHKKVAETLAAEAEPIVQWCWGYGRGNHEDGVIRFNDGFDPAEYVAQLLNVNYLGYSAGIRLSIKPPASSGNHTQTIFIYWHHGYGASRSKGGKKNMLWSLRDKAIADIYMTGHVHEPEAFHATRMAFTVKGDLRQIAKPMVFINGGTYQKNYNPERGASQEAGMFNKDHEVEVDYAEKAAYDPSVIGHYGFSFKFNRRRDPATGKTKWGYVLKPETF